MTERKLTSGKITTRTEAEQGCHKKRRDLMFVITDENDILAAKAKAAHVGSASLNEVAQYAG